MGLARYFLQIGDIPAAIDILEIGINKDPSTNLLYDLLAKVLSDNNEIAKAEIVLERSLHLPADDLDALKALQIKTNESMYDCQMLSKMYNLDHKPEYSSVLKQKIGQYEQIRSNAYEKIYQMLKDKDIPLIAVQYPMKSVKTLMDSLPFLDKRYFVDNEMIFKNAVAKSGYFDYFVNQEFNESGHLTPKGCRLIARNISDTVLAVTQTH